jgi:glucose/arabinose dehydrogenase
MSAPLAGGLDRRPENATCHAPARPSGALVGNTERVFPQLQCSLPVALLQVPGDGSRWFVVEKAGRVLTFANDPAVARASVFVDVTDRVDASFSEAGLLGMAFDPAFATNGFVYLSCTRSGDELYGSVLRIDVDAAGPAPYDIPNGNPFGAPGRPPGDLRLRIPQPLGHDVRPGDG